MIDVVSHILAAANCHSSSGISTPICPGQLPQAPADQNQIKAILSIVFETIGALSLLMIVVSGLRYIISAGDPQKTANAKNSIVYAMVGLAIAITAEAIVAFVGTRI